MYVFAAAGKLGTSHAGFEDDPVIGRQNDQGPGEAAANGNITAINFLMDADAGLVRGIQVQYGGVWGDEHGNYYASKYVVGMSLQPNDHLIGVTGL